MKTDGYYYFTEQGVYGMPALEGLREFRAEGKTPFFVLDSCMCLELVKLADHGKNARVDKRALFGFLDLVKRSKGTMFTIGGLIELSMNRETGMVDREKFFDFFHRMKMVDLLPMRRLRAFNFSFSNYLSLDDPPIPLTINGFDDMMRPCYCCLLKIRDIALENGTSKEKARKNIEAFIDWMVSELDIIMGVEFKLAMNVFGGETSFRKMINLDGKDAVSQKMLMGTAWDICHYRMFANTKTLSAIVSKDAFVVFVTKDGPFYELVKSVITTSLDPGSNLMVDFEKPRFFDDSLTDFVNEKMLSLADSRCEKKAFYDEPRVNRLIALLEQKEY